jgi:hypothetical protein
LRRRIRRSGHPRRHRPGYFAYDHRRPDFPCQLAISDPGTNDELTLPTFAYTYNADGSQTYSWNGFYGKRITADLEVQISSAFISDQSPPERMGGHHDGRGGSSDGQQRA